MSPALRILVSSLAFGAGAAVAGCFGHDDAGQLRDNHFQNAHVDYAVGLPGEGWQRVKVETANIAWVDSSGGRALLVNSHCEGVQDAPLSGLAGELMIGMTERAVQEERLLPFAGREALEMVATGKLDGVVRRRALFVLKKDGCVYDIVYDAPPSSFAVGLDAYHRVRDGLAIGPRRDHR
jgi:hypothetical protein